MQKRLKTLLFKVVIVVFFVALFEGAFTAYAWLKYGTVNVERLHDLQTGNTWATEFDKNHQAAAKFARPHPWLGTVMSHEIDGQSKGPEWASSVVENFPIERDPNNFTILFLGGSTAQMFGRSGELEKTLNERYDFGGRKVVLLNAAMGASAQPRQAIALLLYARSVDAVVSLDGANELRYVRFAEGDRPELGMSLWYKQLNPLAEHGYERIVAIAETNQLKQFSLSHPNSRAIYFATKALRNHVEASIPEVTPPYATHATREQNLEQLKAYLRMMHAMSGEMGLREAYFIQPCPLINKPLTYEEKRVSARPDWPEYAEQHQWLNDQMLSLDARGIPVISLLDVFASTRQTVFTDTIHCNAEGHKIIAARMAAELAKLWQIGDKSSTKVP